MATSTAAQAWTEQHRTAVSTVRYGQCFNNLCERFYKRCDLALNLLQLAAGSTVVAGAIGTLPKGLSAASAAAVAVLALLSMLWQPAVLAERHRAAGARFYDLLGTAWSVKTAQLLRELAAAQRDSPLGLRSLEMPAYVRACRAIGVIPNESLSFLERVCDVIA